MTFSETQAHPLSRSKFGSAVAQSFVEDIAAERSLTVSVSRGNMKLKATEMESLLLGINPKFYPAPIDLRQV